MSKEPNQIEARSALGELYLKRHRLEEAAAEFQAVLESHPEHVEVRSQLARLYLETQRYPRAVSEARRALAGDPEHLQARYILAMALVRNGEIESGRSELAEYQRRFGHAQEEEHRVRELMALNQEALSKIDQEGHEAEAIELFREAVERFPEQASTRISLGLALIKTGDHQGAVEELRRAIELGLDFPEIHRYLSELYHSLGEEDRSLREYEIYENMRGRKFAPKP